VLAGVEDDDEDEHPVASAASRATPISDRFKVADMTLTSQVVIRSGRCRTVQV
jgi:hypothetical protein